MVRSRGRAFGAHELAVDPGLGVTQGEHGLELEGSDLNSELCNNAICSSSFYYYDRLPFRDDCDYYVASVTSMYRHLLESLKKGLLRPLSQVVRLGI